MKIISIQNHTNNYTFPFKQNSLSKNGENNSSSSQRKVICAVASGAALAGVIFSVAHFKNKRAVYESSQSIASSVSSSEYLKNLAESLSRHLNKKVEPESLSSVISGEELQKELKTLNKENYSATFENIKNGVFMADLHSHSNFSDGKGSVKEILENVAEYADFLNEKSGKKFIFALTDHDGINGVKEALSIISESPEKYKNVKFVTGSEISYITKANKTDNPYEISEILVYGFNPFDENITKFFDEIQQRRKKLAEDFIKDLNDKFGYANFTYEEFSKIYLAENQFMTMNNQWKVHDYGQTKNAVAGLAGAQNRNKEEMYAEIMGNAAPRKLRLCDLKEKNLIPQNYGYDSNITAICRGKYTPHNVKGKIEYAGENSFDEIVSVFGKDKDTFGAFAHPYYITERTTESRSVLSDIVERSNGFIKATESYHQAYNPSIDLKEVESFNKYIISNHKLLELGGRDNHDSKWLDFTHMD